MARMALSSIAGVGGACRGTAVRMADEANTWVGGAWCGASLRVGDEEFSREDKVRDGEAESARGYMEV